jgi:uncharacterized repeat protein (TIGR01451 family)
MSIALFFGNQSPANSYAEETFVNEDAFNPPTLNVDDQQGLEIFFRYGSTSGDLKIENAVGQVTFSTPDLILDTQSLEDRYFSWEGFPLDRGDAANPPQEAICNNSQDQELTINKIDPSLATTEGFKYGLQSSRQKQSLGGSNTATLLEKHTGCIRLIVKPKFCTASRDVIDVRFNPDADNSASYQQANKPNIQVYRIKLESPTDTASCEDSNQKEATSIEDQQTTDSLPTTQETTTIEPDQEQADTTSIDQNTPKSNNDKAKTNQGKAVAIQVTDNDTDLDGVDDIDLTSVQISTAPLNGGVTVDQNTGQILYTPNDSFIGTDSFEYIVSDKAGNTSRPALVEVSVASDDQNDANLKVFIDIDGDSEIKTDQEGTLRYVVNYENTGTKPATNVTLKTNLDSNLQFDSCGGTVKCDTSNLPEISWKLGDLSANNSDTVSYRVKPKPSIASTKTLVNQITIESADKDDLTREDQITLLVAEEEAEPTPVQETPKEIKQIDTAKSGGYDTTLTLSFIFMGGLLGLYIYFKFKAKSIKMYSKNKSRKK